MLKVVCKVFAVSCACVLCFLLCGATVQAKTVEYDVNINNVLNVTLQANQVVLDLTPNQKDFDSKNLNVTVSTNNDTGYELVASATNTDLVNTTDNTKTIPTLPTLAGGYTEQTFIANKWGYRVGATGNYNAFSNGPINSNTEATNGDVSTVGFAAKINYDQVPGLYSTTINFSAVARPLPNYIHNLSYAQCTAEPVTVVDARDNEEYTVRRLGDGNCWMTQNLRFTGSSLNPYTSDVVEHTNITWGSSGNDRSTAILVDSGSTTDGVVYNYAGVSAMSVIGDSNTETTTQSICPKGWRLPTDTELSGISSYMSQFSPTVGSWWSADSASATNREIATYNGTNLATSAADRGLTFNVRCVMRVTIDDITTMQDFGNLSFAGKAEVVNTMEEEKVYTLADSRDNKTYNIAKLKDGQVWMTSNLNLAGGTTLNADTSDVPTDNYYTLPASSTSGFSDSSVAYVYNTGNETTLQSGCYTRNPCNSYYSWLAATAGGRDASGNYYDNAAYSICPKGWRLPTVATSDANPQRDNNWKTGDFYRIATAYGTNLESSYDDNSSTFYNNAGPDTTPNFLLAGYYSSSSFSGGGSSGLYWSSFADYSIAYNLSFTRTSMRSAYLYGRNYGFPVRCVLDRDLIVEYNITTMQDFGNLSFAGKAEVVNAMEEEKVYTLADSRDNKTYNIAKLKDGQVWMTSDLNLAGGTTLNTSDSDVPTDNYFTLPASSASGFSSDTTAYVYNSGNETTNQADCTDSQPCNSYYSWLAATAGGKDASGTAVTGDGPDAAYSICPKGWRLPKSGNQSDTSATSTTGYKKGDFYKLATAYGANLESQYYQNSAVFYQNAGPGTLPNFLLAGRYNSSSFYSGGTSGGYWSSSSYFSTNAYTLYFNSSNVNSANLYYRRYGFSVRCVLAEV